MDESEFSSNRATPLEGFTIATDPSVWADLEVRFQQIFYNRTRDEIATYIDAIKRTDPKKVATIRRVLNREAAAETGAVEGLYQLAAGATQAIAAEDPGWESMFGLTEGRRLFDAQFSAYDNVYNAAKGGMPLTEAFIRVTHEWTCANQDTYQAELIVNGSRTIVDRPLPRGSYKTTENYRLLRDGTRANYTHPMEVEHAIRAIVESLSSTKLEDVHPLVRAAYVHYAITAIHPFVDGNGRVARAIASFYTYQHCDLPFIVYADRKQAYFQALEAADRGKPQLFLDYCVVRMEDAAGRALQELDRHQSGTFEYSLAGLLSLVSVRSELTLSDVSSAATLVTDELNARLRAAASVVPDGQGLSIDVEFLGAYQPKGYFFSDHTLHSRLDIAFTLARPAQLRATITIAVGIAKDLSDPFTFAISARTGEQNSEVVGDEHIRLRYEDVYLGIGTGADARINLLVERVLAHGTGLIHRDLRSVLRQLGYEDVS